jgi:hypothetical protein
MSFRVENTDANGNVTSSFEFEFPRFTRPSAADDSGEPGSPERRAWVARQNPVWNPPPELPEGFDLDEDGNPWPELASCWEEPEEE